MWTWTWICHHYRLCVCYLTALADIGPCPKVNIISAYYLVVLSKTTAFRSLFRSSLVGVGWLATTRRLHRSTARTRVHLLPTVFGIVSFPVASESARRSLALRCFPISCTCPLPRLCELPSVGCKLFPIYPGSQLIYSFFLAASMITVF
jgi:hypothetical protein